MPIVIDKDLTLDDIFTGEGLPAFDNGQTLTGQMRPLEIAILNITPDNGLTEKRLLKLISNTPLAIHVTLLYLSSHEKLNTGIRFAEIEDRRFDGMIIAGQPTENLPFNKFAFWKELIGILEWTKLNVTYTMFIGWGAKAALYHFYGIGKHALKEKCCGIFTHCRIRDGVAEPLMHGIDDTFVMPHCHRSIIYVKDIMNIGNLKILAYSKRTGASIIKSVDNRRVFVCGHLEYDRFDLKDIYERDKANGLNPKPPINYFADKEMTDVEMNWSSTSTLFYINWLNLQYNSNLNN